ncbi:MAG: TolB-like translocation protein, partial [Planctomycetota bacterium]
HDAPCLSHDGRRLYFSAGPLGPSGKTERSRFYYVDKTDDGWSEAHLIDSVFNSFKIHWQFSVDRNGSLFFGGKQEGNDEKAEIYFSKYENGRYATPVKLPETINTENAEFSPCIAPDGSYLIFGRAVFPPQARPKFLLYISFRGKDTGWTESVCLSDVLASEDWDLNCKISPDGKYFFFMSMRGGRNGTFWVDATVIDQLRETLPEQSR